MGTERSVSSPTEVNLIDDRIMVRYLEPESITKGGIHLPQQTVKEMKERVQASVVVCVGPGRFTSDGKNESMMDILPGDIVFHVQYLGYLLNIPNPDTGEDEEYRVFGQHDLLGVKRIGRD